MKILNIGSLNLDYTYTVPHFVKSGETLASLSREVHCGGKGLNQSIAMSKAGAQVYHAGCIGSEGSMLKNMLSESGVDVSLVSEVETATGHAIIQVDASGQNCIIIFGGANNAIGKTDVDRYLSHFDAGDILLVQNETSCVPYAIEQAAKKGMFVALNPSPISTELISSPVLEHVNLFILNEIEGHELSGELEPENICTAMRKKYPQSQIMLTLGSAGCIYFDGETFVRQGIYPVTAVDTTGAGDTFAGYFLGCMARGETIERTLSISSMASAIAVSRPGAAGSIPSVPEVCRALEKAQAVS